MQQLSEIFSTTSKSPCRFFGLRIVSLTSISRCCQGFQCRREGRWVDLLRCDGPAQCWPEMAASQS